MTAGWPQGHGETHGETLYTADQVTAIVKRRLWADRASRGTAGASEGPLVPAVPYDVFGTFQQLTDLEVRADDWALLEAAGVGAGRSAVVEVIITDEPDPLLVVVRVSHATVVGASARLRVAGYPLKAGALRRGRVSLRISPL